MDLARRRLSLIFLSMSNCDQIAKGGPGTVETVF
jgi:hypothetical protein